jgi:peroxiredoxin
LRCQGQGQGQGQGKEPLLLPVGIDERPADSAAFAQKLGVPAAVLVDPDGAVRAAFDPQRYPCTFLIDAAGTVRHINRGFGSGYGQRVERWLRDLLALPA